MTDNTDSMPLTANEREMIAFAKQYHGKPIIEAPAQPQAQYTAPFIGGSGRTTIGANGEVINQDFTNLPPFLRKEAGQAAQGTFGTPPASIPVKLGGVGMSAEQARDAVAKGWFSQAEYNDAVVDAMQEREPGFSHADLGASFR